MIEAQFYEKMANNQVRCLLCPHNCKITEGKRGICGVRENRQGILYSLVFEQAIASHVDPIEKKPLFHVYPGSQSFSIATVGCNFKCRFCQNCDISQAPHNKGGQIAGQSLPAETVVNMADRYSCKTIACTYTEPTIYYEYALDIAQHAVKKGIGVIFVSNGYINAEPLRKMAPYLLAANIDLKGWDQEFYRRVVGGDLKKVLDTLLLYKKLNIWLEVTTLVVPTYVDNEDTLWEIAKFIRKELGAETPWHISRFHPQYLCRDLPVTPIEILRRAREIGFDAGLRYVYSGNVQGDAGENTYCYLCHALLIERYGFSILQNNIKNDKCPVCGAAIDGIGLS
ncbi:MAG TPA: AmmeMemoRadiSam system radical SAM enzyme [bacterium]|nr:AmmeMemoRadiSam system radical SAM enzyme [bacterium]HPN44552.1 AmmeMemoRadiSam system radical SAM enzyme [bacterium]